MKDKFYKGILIGAVSYPLFNFFISTLDIVSTWIENKVNLSSAKMIVAAQDLQKKEEEVSTQCIGFQYTPEEEECEECKKERKK
jgi:hypothetical protein